MPTETNKSFNSTQFYDQTCLLPYFSAHIQHQLQDINMFVLRPLGVLVAVLSLVCNTLSLLTVIRCPRLRHPSMLILTSLSVTDLTYGLYALVYEVSYLSNAHICSKQPIEIYGKYIGILCCLTTFTNIAMISRDRYLALSSPTWYRSHMTRPRVFKGILSCWLCSAMSILIIFALDKARFNHQGPFFAIVFLCYITCSFMIVLNYIRFLVRNRRSSRIVGINMRSVAQRERKMARVVSLIVLCFLFTVLPATLSPVILTAMRVPLHRFGTLNNLLMTTNGLLNPLLNYGRNKDLRKVMLEMIKCNQSQSMRHLKTIRYDSNSRVLN